MKVIELDGTKARKAYKSGKKGGREGDFRNSVAYVMYKFYNWVGIHTWNSNSKLCVFLLDAFARFL